MDLFLDVYSIVSLALFFFLFVIWNKDTTLNLFLKFLMAFMTIGSGVFVISQFGLQIVAG